MNIWHDIDEERIYPTDFMAVIEITKGSKQKYELDKETGLLMLDRVLFTATHYPMNYGFIPRTYGDDGDPLDVLVLCSEPIQPLTLVRCYPIGVMKMEDNGMGDEKIIAIPYSDPTYMGYTDIKELPKHIFEELKHFFTNYKSLEGKSTTVTEFGGPIDAVEVIEYCMENYKRKFVDGDTEKKEMHTPEPEKTEKTETYTLEPAKMEEAGLCNEILDMGRKFQREQGFVQWTDDYPSLDTVREDIEKKRGYVLKVDGTVAAYMCVDFGGEPAYDDIEGAWLSDRPYVVSHRMAFHKDFRGRGLTKVAFRKIEEMSLQKGVTSFRVDTGFENQRMQHVLERLGFVKCGVIQYEGSGRLAYEKLL